MAQRHSEYARIDGDTYVTPDWVYEELYKVEFFREPWDCAPVNSCFDFLTSVSFTTCDIVSNPPFKLAEKFCRHALDVTKEARGKVAMLLPVTFDCAKTRRDLFEFLPFKIKYTFTTRIRWTNLEQKKAGPSTNHAFYVWDWQYIGPAQMGWLPIGEGRWPNLRLERRPPASRGESKPRASAISPDVHGENHIGARESRERYG